MTHDADPSRYIPAHIKRLVLLEAGHSCAIPTCQHYATDFAHIIPFAQVREHTADNSIALCPNHHDAYDNRKLISRKSMRLYKQKLQLLSKRYTKYELRILVVLATKPVVAAAGEVQMMGLLEDGLVRNVKTFASHTLTTTDSHGDVTFQDTAVLSFAAQLTQKGKDFIETWKSNTDPPEALFL